MTPPRILGLDLSLTRTGYATPAGHAGVIVPSRTLRGMARLDFLRCQVHAILRASDCEVVAIEGYSFGSRYSHAHALGELGGLVRHMLWGQRVPYVDVPPTSLKKFATGKGNAPKGAVLAEAIRRLGYQGSDDNEADALWLRALASHYYGHPVVEVPKTHLAALDKVEFPNLVRVS